jgi:hypothetical protein
MNHAVGLDGEAATSKADNGTGAGESTPDGESFCAPSGYRAMTHICPVPSVAIEDRMSPYPSPSTGNSVTTPPGVIRPSAVGSVNQRLPSGPAVTAWIVGALLSRNSRVVPSGARRAKLTVDVVPSLRLTTYQRAPPEEIGSPAEAVPAPTATG